METEKIEANSVATETKKVQSASTGCVTDKVRNRVAQNEEIFEKYVSLCGLVFLLVQKTTKKNLRIISLLSEAS